MIYIQLKHRVSDFGKWKTFFDSDYASRKDYGIEVKKLFRSISDPNEVHILFSAPSEENVRRMTERPELKELMAEAGVISEPEIRLFNLVQ